MPPAASTGTPTGYASPAAASAGLTAAFNPTTPQQKAAIANAAALVPTAPAPTKTTEPTVISSGNVDEKNQQNIQTASTAPPKGQTSGTDGFVRNADQSFAEAPSDATQTVDQQGNATWQSGGLSYAIGPSGGKVSQDPFIQGIYDQFTSLKAQMDATGAANIQAIRDSYDALIREQKQSNAGTQAGLYSLLARGGSLQTASSGGLINAQVSYGLNKIADLNNKENAAVVAAQQAMQNNDFKLLDKQLSIAADARKTAQDAAQKLNDAIMASHAQATKDAAISNVLSQGITDPATILKTLRDQGDTTTTAKDIADTIANLNPDAKNIMDLLKTLAANNAPPEIRAAVGKAKNYTEAINAGGSWLSNNPDVIQYNTYKSQAIAAGQNPVSYDSWQSNRKYMDAYSTARGTEAGKLSVTGATQPATNIQSKSDIPRPLQPYAFKSASGAWYLDLSSIGANLRPSLINQAGDMTVITDKNQAADLKNQEDSISKLQIIAKLYSDIAQPSAAARDLYGAGLTKAAILAQTDPKKAAAVAVNDSALDILKAISGVQGFRGNQSAIQQIKDALPKPTDTQDVAAQKLSLVAAQIQAREQAILGGTSGPTDYTQFTIRSEDQAKNALIEAGNKNPDMRGQITAIMQTTNPDTGQPYSYLESAQILGIDIPALSNQRSIFQGGTLLPNLWREIMGQGI